MQFLVLALGLSAFSITPSRADDCVGLPWVNVVKVGQVSPSQAKLMLKTGDFRIVPELDALGATPQELMETLQLGLKIQKFGNDSWVRNLDALLYLVKGKLATAPASQQVAYSLIEKFTSDSLGMDYYDTNQFASGVRMVATLQLMGRTQEADLLQALLKQTRTKFNGGLIQDLSLKMNYNGRIKNAKQSVRLCEELKAASCTSNFTPWYLN